jgi:hypothetical protein
MQRGGARVHVVVQNEAVGPAVIRGDEVLHRHRSEHTLLKVWQEVPPRVVFFVR